MEQINTNTNNYEIQKLLLDPKVQKEINENNKKTLDLIAFQHIKEELEKYNNWEYFFITHQTIEQSAINIMQSWYFGRVWLNGTSLISNLDSIINTCYFLEQWIGSAPNFQRHRWSDSLVIMIVKKSQFKDCRNLTDIDAKLIDYVEWWEINSWWLPNSCIWWYINWVSYHKNHNFTWKIWHWI